MIGNFRILVAASFAFISMHTAAQASCAQFEAEAEAVSGVVPKFDDNGKLRAIVTYGEGTFLVPKRSLINTAREKATMNAKKAFSAWMEESIESESVVADLTEVAQETNQNGETVGMARELETSINVMRSNTSAVLSGLVKLDECVDTEQKFILVELGWKPSLSAAAADTKSTINNEVARGQDGGKNSSGSAVSQSPSQITPSSGYRKKSSMKDDF